MNQELFEKHLCTQVASMQNTEDRYTSVKIELTPPMDSYTTILLVHYSRLILIDDFSGSCKRLGWQYLALILHCDKHHNPVVHPQSLTTVFEVLGTFLFSMTLQILQSHKC